MSTGSPKGCVSSPLLFTVYTPLIVIATYSKKMIVKYADDSTIIGLINSMTNHAIEQDTFIGVQIVVSPMTSSGIQIPVWFLLLTGLSDGTFQPWNQCIIWTFN